MVVLVGMHNASQSPVDPGSPRLLHLLAINQKPLSVIIKMHLLQEPDEFKLGGLHDEFHCLVHQRRVKCLLLFLFSQKEGEEVV